MVVSYLPFRLMEKMNREGTAQDRVKGTIKMLDFAHAAAVFLSSQVAKE